MKNRFLLATVLWLFGCTMVREPNSSGSSDGGGGDLGGGACVNCKVPRVCCGGECVDLHTNVKHCGQCTTSCGPGSACVSGHCQCGVKSCAAGEQCCSVNRCTAVQTDVQNCGSCGHACGKTEQCTGGKCVPAPGCVGCQGECCSGVCIDTDSDPQHCGGCITSCTGIDQCIDGQCVAPGKDASSCGCNKVCLTQCIYGCCLEDILLGSCAPDANCLGLPG